MPDQPDSQHTSSSIIGRTERFHLKTQLEELQRRYEKLTTRLAAIDTDIDRERDSERRLALRERRNELAEERDQIVANITQIRQQSGIADSAPPVSTPDSWSQSQPLPNASSSEAAPAEENPTGFGTQPSITQPGDSSPAETESRFWFWGIAGTAIVSILGVLFFNTFACIIEYRLTEAVVGLLVFLAGGAALVFTRLVPIHWRSRLQVLYGGSAIALLLLVLMALILPAPSVDTCTVTFGSIDQVDRMQPPTVGPESDGIVGDKDNQAGASATSTIAITTTEPPVTLGLCDDPLPSETVCVVLGSGQVASVFDNDLSITATKMWEIIDFGREDIVDIRATFSSPNTKSCSYIFERRGEPVIYQGRYHGYDIRVGEYPSPFDRAEFIVTQLDDSDEIRGSCMPP